MMRRINIQVSGRVQGVCFRAFTRNKAKRLGITGSAINLDDGRVDIIAQGDPKVIEQFILWCRKGPITARVDQIEISELPISDEITSFDIG